jgi:peptidoglycan/LPS O-acetylase OafA/YrhL
MIKRISELDGIRAIAVGLVFLVHFAPTKPAPWLDLVHRVGWVGVDVFFVLSGFLVTTVLLKARTNPEGYFRGFYARRALRLFPLYYLVLTLILLTMLVTRNGIDLRHMQATWGNPLWFYAYMGNFRTAVTNISPPSFFTPMWSLHVEEQFYLLLPPLAFYLKRERLKRLLIAAVLLAPAIRALVFVWRPDWRLFQYMLLPCRMDALALGGLLAIYSPDPAALPRRVRLPLFVGSTSLLVLAVAVFQWSGGPFDGAVERIIGFTLFDVAFVGFTALVLNLRGTVATAWLNWKPLQYVGMISYGVYLFQVPASGVVDHILHLMGQPVMEWDATIGRFAAVGATTLVLSTLSWYLWETKWLALKSRLADAPREPALVVTQHAYRRMSEPWAG